MPASQSFALAGQTAAIPPTGGQWARARPFAGLIDAVIVHAPAEFAFDGSVLHEHALAAWLWFARDLGRDAIPFEAVEDGTLSPETVTALLPALLGRAREALPATRGDYEVSRRVRVQLGSDAAVSRLPIVLNALRNRDVLVKAQTFGRAVNAMQDETAVPNALRSMPLSDAAFPLLLHAALGEVTNPTRLVTGVLRISADPTQAGIVRAGFGPLIDAILAHAQNQQHMIQPMGAFADIDLTCRALERYHRLVRAVAGYVELERGGRWTEVLAGLAKSVSGRVEPRLREVVTDINLALRRAREGADRLDADRVLAAVNGVYLLAALRECKDSLALNALFEQAWAQCGQALDLHLIRNLELLRADPNDPIMAARVDAGIKMAELRFNAEYAETLARARSAAIRG